MKIAFIGQKNIGEHSGSVEKHVRQLAASMGLMGHEVTVYAQEPSGDSISGVSTIVLPGFPLRGFETISRNGFATVHALFQKYDIVHFHSTGPSVFSLLPRIFRPDMRVVATVHGRDYLHHHRNRLSRMLLRWAEFIACTVPEKTIVVSKTLARYVEAAYRKPFTLIPHGIEATLTDRTDFLRKQGLKERRYLLSVSRLARHKGIHYLIKAFQALKETSELPNNWKLVIVGTQREVKDYAAYLRFLAVDDADVLFLDECQPEDLSQLYSNAGVFVCLSEDEDLSLMLLEALGHGLPCVVSDTPANREAVADCGVVCEPKNILDLKQKISSLINRPDTMKSLSFLAQARARSEYDQSAIAGRTISLYEDLLTEKQNLWKISFGLKNK